MVKTISNIIFPLITFPYVSRILMPENVGKVNFGSSFVSYFTLIASLGITTYAIRECSAKRENQNELSKTASQIFSINIVTTAISYMLMVMTLLLFRKFDSYRALIIIQSIVILFNTWGCDWLNSAMEDFTFITVRTIAFQAISLVLMFVFVQQPEDYIKYAAITVLSSSGANIVNIFYRKKYCTVRFVKYIDWKKHFKPILLLFVMLLAQTIFNSSDITMLGLIKGNYEVGLYSTAVKITNLISQVVASLLWVVMPRLSLYFANGDFFKINELLKKIFSVFLILGLPCAVGCIELSKEIIWLIAGDNYLGAIPSLNILMIGFLFNLVGSSFLGNMVLLPAKREVTFMVIFCISTMVNITLNFFMIPLWGATAASITTSISYFLIWMMCILTKDKRIHITGIAKTLITSLFGCVGIALCCSITKRIFQDSRIILVIAMIGSVTVYFAVQIVLKNDIIIEGVNALKNKIYHKR